MLISPRYHSKIYTNLFMSLHKNLYTLMNFSLLRSSELHHLSLGCGKNSTLFVLFLFKVAKDKVFTDSKLRYRFYNALELSAK